MLSRRVYALFGVLSTLVGMAVGHFVASLLNPDSSPVVSVATSVIDLTPTPVKDWGIEHFESDGFSFLFIEQGPRNYDKVVLVGSVMIGVLVLAGIAGLLARLRFAYGAGLIAALVVVAGVSVLTRPTVEVLDVVPVIFTMAAGLGALWYLDQQARASAGLAHSLPPRLVAGSTTGSAASSKPRSVLGGTTATVPASGHDVVDSEDADRSALPGASESDDPRPVGASRRGVLIAAGVVAAAAAVLGGAGRWITNLRARPEDIALPDPASPLGPLPADLSDQYTGITPLRVSNADFYRVDTRIDTPVVDSEGWTLTVDGDVENELTITFDDLLDMDLVERDITLTCVSNTVGGRYVGGARWLGVPLKTILDMAGVKSGADQILSTDFDGMTISTPLDLATDGRDALIAVGMNGEALPREHGFPVRMVIPGLYGFISATKWLTKLTLTTYADQEAYWTVRDWATDAPIKPSARIDTPKPLASVDAGEVIIGGVAWAQNDDGVSKVQVQIDGGPWRDAELGADVNSVYWRQWYYKWDAQDSGGHRISARVIDGDGDTQSTAVARPFPDGASGIHTYAVTVA